MILYIKDIDWIDININLSNKIGWEFYDHITLYKEEQEKIFSTKLKLFSKHLSYKYTIKRL